jgi:hypothetical protein
MALDVIDFSAEGLPAYVVKESAAGRPEDRSTATWMAPD